MRKINIETIIISIVINLSMILFFNNINTTQSVINETKSETLKIREQEQNNINQIYCTYEEYVDGKVIVDFSDSSYAIINHEEQEYIFQPVCMGDWDMQFETFEHLKMAMETYFKYSNVSVIETKLDQ